MRLLVILASQLDKAMLAELELAILKGPPVEMFKFDIEPEQLTLIIDHSTWLRLPKLKSAGATIGEIARKRFEAISAQNPKWLLQEEKQDEFPVWTGGVWVGDRDPLKPFTPIPSSEKEIVEYLIAHHELEFSEQDDWRERCSENFPATSSALRTLAQRNIWPDKRWRDALQVWSKEDELNELSWHKIAPILVSAPDDFMHLLANGISWWLQSIAKTFQENESLFLLLCRRILELKFDVEVKNDDPIFSSN